MGKDKLAFLEESEEREAEVEADVKAEAAQPEPEAPPEAEEVEAEPAEEPKAEQSDTGEKEAAPPPGEAQETKAIPFAALMDERDKRKAAEQEAAELRKWKEEQERKAREAAQTRPDLLDDPDAWQKHQQQVVEQQIFNARLDASEFAARARYGDDTVQAAQDAFLAASQSDPMLGQKLYQERDPYSFVVSWHKQQSLISEIGNDPEAWRQAERERIKQELMAEMNKTEPLDPASPSIPAAPPRSLASAPSTGTGGAKPAHGPGAAFDEVFPD